MVIRDLLKRKASVEVLSIGPDGTLHEAARKMVTHSIGALAVVDRRQRLAGIVSERDLVRAISRCSTANLTSHVRDVMTQTVITCTSNDDLLDVLSLMIDNGIRHMPVRDGVELRGMVSIRELDKACEHLQAQANTDVLTGLANRRHFIHALEIELNRFQRYGHPLSVAMLDVDHFKRINDGFGHETGDKVLCALADLITRQLRTIDRVGRMGGEEFAIILPETDLPRARHACERLMGAIRAAEIDADDAKICFTVSMGLTEAGPDTRDVNGILKQADALLYDAKARGRDRIETDELQKSSQVAGKPAAGAYVKRA